MFGRFLIWLALALLPIAAQAAPVGFQPITLPGGIKAGVWYPSKGEPTAQPIGLDTQMVVVDGKLMPGRHPLIVMSHGNGGSFDGHRDTAQALAAAGFIVAALTHPGDNWRDQSRATMLEDRPAALSGLIDYMLMAWPLKAGIDPRKVGAFGFSAGGFTVLAAAGGRPDWTRVAEHCRNPAFYDCQLLKQHPRPAGAVATWSPDRRIKALVVAAPALGFAFGRDGLAAVRVPVQLWRADDDQILPPTEYADAVRVALPRAPEFHSVAHGGHFDFLAPCSATLASRAQAICVSAKGFDRRACHAHFNAEVVRFFSVRLGKRGVAS